MIENLANKVEWKVSLKVEKRQLKKMNKKSV